MQSIYLNPYQTELKTEITHRKHEGETTHLCLKDTICVDYDALGLPLEPVSLSGLPLLRTYTAGDELIHVVQGKPAASSVALSAPHETRIRLLRECSIRLLFRHVLRQYFNRVPYNFRTAEHESRFLISGNYTQQDMLRLHQILTDNTQRLIRAGLYLTTREKRTGPETALFGLDTFPWSGPHLANTSEICDFRLEPVHRCAHSCEIRYRLM
ncbi:MAG: hypothetical protein SOR89_00790 [Ndongobacter sp.]|nr:hypothetical protein [Ndongobacter sp.]